MAHQLCDSSLHDFDFVFGQAVKLIDQRVYLLVGGGDGVLERVPVRPILAMTSGDAALRAPVASRVAQAADASNNSPA